MHVLRRRCGREGERMEGRAYVGKRRDGRWKGEKRDRWMRRKLVEVNEEENWKS